MNKLKLIIKNQLPLCILGPKTFFGVLEAEYGNFPDSVKELL
jgi:hypothetical protein